MDLSIIILNYNTKDFLLECLVALRKAKSDGFKFELIVVDNASTDGSVDAISKFQIPPPARGRPHPKFQIIKSKKNIGFSAGNNLAVKRAKGKYFLFLNPDTVVAPNTFVAMLRFMEKNPDVGAATCKVILPGGEIDESSHRGFPTPLNAFCYFSGLERLFPKSRIFAGYTLGWMAKNTIHEVDAAAGAFLIVRRAAGEEVGWWDEDYFWYGEDLDFCFRLKEKGWKIIFMPTTKILHYGGVASGIKGHSRKIATANLRTRLHAAHQSTRAMRIFYRKHYAKRYPKIVMFLVFAGITFIEWARKLRQVF